MSEGKELSGNGFFRLTEVGGKWTFVHPDGGPFFCIGLNHAEESNLKYPHNIDIWRKKYGSRAEWMKQGPLTDLPAWGFNTLGWTQEYVAGELGGLDWFGLPINHAHSRGWSQTELASCGMPYVTDLPVADFQDWRRSPTFPDVFSTDFDDWCAFLARSVCVDHADNRNLLGYFLVDIPSWVPHTSGRFFPGMEGLKGDAYDNRLHAIATQYFSTVHKYIRSVDPNHLIFGDRFNGNKAVPDVVLDAMKPYVDAVSIQYFCGPSEKDRAQMVSVFSKAQAVADKPVMNIDLGNWTGTALNPERASGLASQAERGRDYAASLGALVEKPWFVGWQWCAYVENLARGWGLKDPWDNPYDDFVQPVRQFNLAVVERHERQVQALLDAGTAR